MTEKIRTLQIIHLAICAGTIVVYLTVGQFSIDKLKINAIDSSEIIYAAIPVLAFLLSNLLFKSQLKQINPKLALNDKLPVYQTASIIRWAVLEGAAFMLLFLKPDFMVLGILIIAYLVFLRPTEDRITSDFENSVL